ncbi:transglutaminase [Solidesulfovibrio carbinolicus]|uniref:Transglutaminase n=2 Tax=Solidesulfovibrio carbinolicus TaxID=296842 RepID=A0A4P6HP77_9BACT|nr:transglutaminase [Solidesulfovibrio carbinolicus]
MMASLDEYLFAMEALPEEALNARSLVVLDLAAAATGTCGVVTAGHGLALPLPAALAQGSWQPAAAARLPILEIQASQAGWRPGVGETTLPPVQAAATGTIPALAEAVLVPLFALAGGGAWAALTLPLTVLGLSDLSRRGSGAPRLPRLIARGQSCSLESPALTGVVDAARAVALLGVGDPDLAEAVAGLPSGDDAIALALLDRTARALTYVADADDAWRCAPATLALGQGDCEDGAILLHGLMLAAGLPADRIVTVFGRVGANRDGHAWVAWRRRGDGRWTALDWTLGPTQGPMAALPAMGDPNIYVFVDYALTSGAFFPVRQEAAVFFARAAGDGVVLPRPACRAGAAHGAAAEADLPAGWEASSQTGARAAPTLAAPTVVGRAGYSRAGLAWPSLGLAALAGGLCGLPLPGWGGTGFGGGGGQAAAGLPEWAGLGQAVQAALVSGQGRLPCPDCRAWGLAGAAGFAACRLWPPRGAGIGLAGPLGDSAATLPCLFPDGSGRPESLALAAVALGGPVAAGLGRAQRLGLAGRGNGEEWT